MSINSLPASLHSVIQQGFLERQFQQALRAKLGFRAIADREDFGANIGETITKTRVGLLNAVTSPMATAAVTDFTSGLTNANYGVEQYILGVNQYALPMQLNIATARTAIADLYLQNAYALGENAHRSVDGLAQMALFDSYMGGNTRVTTTLGTPGTAVHVDDVRGFFMTWNSKGQPVAVSASNTLAVQVGSDTYTLTGVTADGTAPTTINGWLSNLAFLGSSSNSSTTPGGYSGTLTFSGNVTVADATALNAVVSAVAPLVQRPYITSSGAMEGTASSVSTNYANDDNKGRLTMQMLLNAKATMAANAVGPVDAVGNYVLYADPIHLTGLYADPAFQYFFRGEQKSAEYRRGVIAELLGITIEETNLNPVQSLNSRNVRRAALCGQGALVEGVFTNTGYAAANQVDDADGMITVVDGIAHITREPLDALKQVVTQSWSYIGGFVAPTDTTTNTNTVPTASNSAWKRAVILESL